MSPPTRSPSSLLTLLTLLFTLLLHTATPAFAFNAFNAHLKPAEQQCFYEQLKEGDRLDLSFQVAEGGNLEVDFWITSPDTRVLHSIIRRSQGTFGFNAVLTGRYDYCFANRYVYDEKLVTFTVQGPDEMTKIEEKIDADKTHHTPLDDEIRTLADNIRGARNEQSFMNVRLTQHQNTAASTSSRIMYWSFIQSGLLVGVCVFQVTYLKRGGIGVATNLKFRVRISGEIRGEDVSYSPAVTTTPT
ncbi:p24 complex component [Quaeritorhiza haematococci]|nr:p24 complex component [Quaeritorhiza haematococci]